MGAGVGGHCIPINPYFLINDAVDINIDLSIVKTARAINDSMPNYVASEVKNGLEFNGRRLPDAKIVILGAAFKSNVSELRYSPSHEIQKILTDWGANVLTYDPLCSKDNLSSFGYTPVDNIEGALNGADCLVIAVNHDVFSRLDYQRLVKLMRTNFLFDCCGMIQPRTPKNGRRISKRLEMGS